MTVTIERVTEGPHGFALYDDGFMLYDCLSAGEALFLAHGEVDLTVVGRPGPIDFSLRAAQYRVLERHELALQMRRLEGVEVAE
jgi:hypothetical protein